MGCLTGTPLFMPSPNAGAVVALNAGTNAGGGRQSTHSSTHAADRKHVGNLRWCQLQQQQHGWQPAASRTFPSAADSSLDSYLAAVARAPTTRSTGLPTTSDAGTSTAAGAPAGGAGSGVVHDADVGEGLSGVSIAMPSAFFSLPSVGQPVVTH